MAETFTHKLTATITTGLVLIVALLVWFWVSHARLEQAPDVVLQFIEVEEKISIMLLKQNPLTVMKTS